MLIVVLQHIPHKSLSVAGSLSQLVTRPHSRERCLRLVEYGADTKYKNGGYLMIGGLVGIRFVLAGITYFGGGDRRGWLDLVQLWTGLLYIFRNGFPFVGLLFINLGLLHHVAHRTSVADACMRLAFGHALDEMRFAMGSRSSSSPVHTVHTVHQSSRQASPYPRIAFRIWNMTDLLS